MDPGDIKFGLELAASAAALMNHGSSLAAKVAAAIRNNRPSK